MSSDPKGYYSELGVSQTAPIDEIKIVYRALAKIYHPDVNRDISAANKFRRLTEAYEVLADSEKRLAYDADARRSSYTQRAPPNEQSSRPHNVDLVKCSQCGKVTAQPRFLIFAQVASVIVFTRINSKAGIFCSSCAAKVAVRASAISAALGWWGIPWGPIHTVTSIVKNAFGGERRKNIDEELIWRNVVAFVKQGKMNLAASLALSLKTSNNTKLAVAAAQFCRRVSEQGIRPRELRSVWVAKSYLIFTQLLMGAVVPGVTLLLVFVQSPRQSNPLPSTDIH
jgi:hypothetical protein